MAKEGGKTKLKHDDGDQGSQGELILEDNQSGELRINHSLLEGGGHFKVQASRIESPKNARRGTERG